MQHSFHPDGNLGATAANVLPRSSSSPKLLTTKDVATLLRVGKDKILKFIYDGELAAIDISSRSSARPQYRIEEAAVNDFIDHRRREQRPAAVQANTQRQRPLRPPGCEEKIRSFY